MYGYASLPLQYAAQHLAPAAEGRQPARGAMRLLASVDLLLRLQSACLLQSRPQTEEP